MKLFTLFVIILALCAFGCSRQAQGQSGSTRQMGEGLAGAAAYTKSADASVQKAMPHSDSEGKVNLDDAHVDLQAALGQLDATRASLAAEEKAYNDLVKAKSDSETALKTQVADTKAALAKEKASFHDRLGWWLCASAWLMGVSWLLLQIGVACSGYFNSLGLAYKIFSEIARFLPLSNIASRVRDKILLKRAK